MPQGLTIARARSTLCLGTRMIIQHRCKVSHIRKTAKKISKLRPTIGVPLDNERLASINKVSVKNLYLAIKDQARFPQMLNDRGFEAALYAFFHRAGLADLTDWNFIKPAFTLITDHGILPSEFSRLQTRGSLLIKLFVADYIYAKYPNLGQNLYDQIANAYLSSEALGDVAKILGISQTLLISNSWRTTYSADEKYLDNICIKSLEAVVGALYLNSGAVRAHTFVKEHILSREINTYEFVLEQYPAASIIAIFKVLGREEPVARLLAETGRCSNDPTFLVGIYSGTKELAQASGHSLQAAENRACREVLRSHYFAECEQIIPTQYELLGLNKDASLMEATRGGCYQVKAEA